VKYTPGPWIVDENEVEHTCCWDCGVTNSFTVDNIKNYIRIAECNKENANLIAQAPKMLESLIRYFKKDYYDDRMVFTHRYVLKRHKEIVALIERATGMEIEDILKEREI
jgi:hypothetical protein